MRRPTFIATQSRRPSGVLGGIIARIMAKETAVLNDAAIQALQLGPAERFLEVGFGHGRTLALAAERVGREGLVSGVDASEAMVRMARRRLRSVGCRVDLHLGSSSELPFAAASFDEALAVHTLYFWEEPEVHLLEIRRVLRPGGVFVLGFTSSEDTTAVRSFPASVYRFYAAEQVQTLLATAGFASIELTPTNGKHLARAVSGANTPA